MISCKELATQIVKYFKKSSNGQKNLILPAPALLEIKASEKPLYSSFHYVNQLGDISGDNFVLETAFKNIYNDKWAVCAPTHLIIVGTKNALIIPFSIPGCVSNNGLMMSDVFLSGKENDLSMFGTDMTDFQDFTGRAENKKVTISIGDLSVYASQYNESVGNIVGVRYRFLGAGEVDYLKLKRLDSNDYIMTTDFNLPQYIRN